MAGALFSALLCTLPRISQRPYTTLELYHKPGQTVEPPGEAGAGMDGLVMMTGDMRRAGLSVTDPSGVKLTFTLYRA